MTVKPSLILLTWNRKTSVNLSLFANLNSAGYPLHELIHVDNGSEPGFTEWFKAAFNPDTQVINKTNLGVAAGYNRGLAMATGTHVVITGCDRIMPMGWLKKWVEAFEAIPDTGVISCYSNYEKDISSRYLDSEEILNEIKIRKAIPVEARMHSRDFLFKVGFFREDFGLYGYEDAEWSDRANTYAWANSFRNYTLPDLGIANHLSDDDFGSSVSGVSYRKFKDSIHPSEKNKNLFELCHKLGSPHYNPFARLEPKIGE